MVPSFQSWQRFGQAETLGLACLKGQKQTLALPSCPCISLPASEEWNCLPGPGFGIFPDFPDSSLPGGCAEASQYLGRMARPLRQWVPVCTAGTLPSFTWHLQSCALLLWTSNGWYRHGLCQQRAHWTDSTGVGGYLLATTVESTNGFQQQLV